MKTTEIHTETYTKACREYRQAKPRRLDIPTTDAWDTLVKHPGNGEFSGDIVKEKGTAHWIAPNEFALNSLGCTALPGGYRNGINDAGSFYGAGKHGLWWSSGQGNSTSYSGRSIDFIRNYMVCKYFIKKNWANRFVA